MKAWPNHVTPQGTRGIPAVSGVAEIRLAGLHFDCIGSAGETGNGSPKRVDSDASPP